MCNKTNTSEKLISKKRNRFNDITKKSISFYYVNINLNILNIEKCLTLIQKQSKNNLVGKKDFFWFKFKNNHLACMFMFLCNLIMHYQILTINC